MADSLLMASESEAYSESTMTIAEDDLFETASSDAYLYLKGHEDVDSVRDYLRLIGKIALLSAEEEVTLAKRIEAGLLAGQALREKEVRASLGKRYTTKSLELVAADGAVAKRQFYEANLRLVVWQAKRLRSWSRHRQSLMDVVQWGNIGLMRAVERFDYTKGYKFSTYASWWIRKEILENRSHNHALTLTENAADDVERMYQTEKKFFDSQGRYPSLKELAKEMDKTPERIAELKRGFMEPFQLDRPLTDEDKLSDALSAALQMESYSLEDIVTGAIATAMVREWLQGALEALTKEGDQGVLHADFLRRRFGFGTAQQSLAALSIHFGRSKQTMSNWQEKCLTFLRNKAAEDDITLE